jgi:hypothetical protein
LYRLTRKPLWLERAHDFARRMFTYRTTTPEGDMWQSDDTDCHSLDFMFGAAGTGHFFLRLWQPDRVTRRCQQPQSYVTIISWGPPVLMHCSEHVAWLTPTGPRRATP